MQNSSQNGSFIEGQLAVFAESSCESVDSVSNSENSVSRLASVESTKKGGQVQPKEAFGKPSLRSTKGNKNGEKRDLVNESQQKSGIRRQREGLKVNQLENHFKRLIRRRRDKISKKRDFQSLAKQAQERKDQLDSFKFKQIQQRVMNQTSLAPSTKKPKFLANRAESSVIDNEEIAGSLHGSFQSKRGRRQAKQPKNEGRAARALNLNTALVGKRIKPRNSQSALKNKRGQRRHQKSKNSLLKIRRRSQNQRAQKPPNPVQTPKNDQKGSQIATSKPKRFRSQLQMAPRRQQPQLTQSLLPGLKKAKTLNSTKNIKKSRTKIGSEALTMAVKPTRGGESSQMSIAGKSPPKKSKHKNFSFAFTAESIISFSKNKASNSTQNRHERHQNNKKYALACHGPKTIIQGLEARNWQQIEENALTTTEFTIKLIRPRPEDHFYQNLKKGQFVNFFRNTNPLCSKSELPRLLRHAWRFCDADPLQFFPRSFDLDDESERAKFVREFKLTHAESILKRYLSVSDAEVNVFVLEIAILVLKRKIKNSTLGGYLELFKDNISKIGRVYSVVERNGRVKTSEYDFFRDGKIVSRVEWEILKRWFLSVSQMRVQMETQPNFKLYLRKLKKVITKKIFFEFSTQFCFPGKPKEASESTKNSQKGSKNRKSQPKSGQNSIHQKTQKEPFSGNSRTPDEFLSPSNKAIYLKKRKRQILHLLKLLQKNFSQTAMNGLRNTWILKPSNSSQGHGIKLIDRFSELLLTLKTKPQRLIAQKYIENPFLYKQRKLDIRQWVLVTSFNPVRAWIYSECYIRVSTNRYNMSDLGDKLSHLTNISVSKKAPGYDPEECFMSQYAFARVLDARFNRKGVFEEVVRPQIEAQVRVSLGGAVEVMWGQANAAHIFGYDFFVGEDLRVWLVEVNRAPGFTANSSLKERLVRECSESYLKVVIDYEIDGKTIDKEDSDFGKFDLLYIGPKVKQVNKLAKVDFDESDRSQLFLRGTKITKMKAFRYQCMQEDQQFYDLLLKQ